MSQNTELFNLLFSLPAYHFVYSNSLYYLSFWKANHHTETFIFHVTMSNVLQPLEEEKVEEQKPRNQEEEESKKEELLGSLCTPTSSDHKIPEVDTCPPAPRKRPREIPPTKKRRLSKDLRFFEATDAGSHEVETLFVHNSAPVRKKRRSNSA